LPARQLLVLMVLAMVLFGQGFVLLAK